MQITGLGKILGNSLSEGFVEIAIPLDDALLTLDNPEFLTGKAYDQSTVQR